MNDLAPTALTSEQANFVYNIEVLGMPARVAAASAGMSIAQIASPTIISARLALRKELQGRMVLTKEDSLHGIQEAIRDAKLLSDPGVQIKGWQAINDMLGFNAPQVMQVDINVPLDIVKKNIRTLPDAELIKLLGADSVIDGDFCEIEKKSA